MSIETTTIEQVAATFEQGMKVSSNPKKELVHADSGATTGPAETVNPFDGLTDEEKQNLIVSKTTQLTYWFKTKEEAFAVCKGQDGPKNSKISKAFKAWNVASDTMKILLGELVDLGYGPKYLFTLNEKRVNDRGLIPYLKSGVMNYLALSVTAKSIDSAYRIVVTIQGIRNGLPFVRVRELPVNVLWLKYGGDVKAFVNEVCKGEHTPIYDATLIKSEYSKVVREYEKAVATEQVAAINRAKAIHGKDTAITMANTLQHKHRAINKVVGKTRKEIRNS